MVFFSLFAVLVKVSSVTLSSLSFTASLRTYRNKYCICRNLNDFALEKLFASRIAVVREENPGVPF